MNNETLQQALDKILEGRGLEYKFINGVVVIRKASTITANPKGDEKLSVYKVTGTVVDKDGKPIYGCSVSINDTFTGTTTSADGYFTLEVKDNRNVIVTASYLGMKEQSVKWNGAKLRLVLENDATQIEDIVITGYQVIDKKKLTSAVATVRLADVMMPNISSIDRMLEGKISDMTVLSNSGEVGTVPRIRIRGTSTLIGNREPLWVVDGIVVTDPVQVSAEELNDPDYINRVGNAISGINPQDIERIDVLKDASATALYGVKAANGVIVVTTKKGRVGKPQVGYYTNLTYKSRPRYTDRGMNLMNSRQRVGFSRDLLAAHHSYESNASLIGYEGLIDKLYRGQISQSEFQTGVARLETMNTDWFGILTKDAISQQHTLSVSGGSDNVRYYGSIGYTVDNDVIRNNNNNRYTGTLNLNIRITNKLSAAFNMNANAGNRHYNQSEIAPIDYAYNTSRAISPYNNDGDKEYYKRISGLNAYRYNILNELDNSGVRQNNLGATLTTNISYAPTNWLTARAIFSYNASSADIENYWNDNTYYIARLRLSDYGVMPPAGVDSFSTCPFGGELAKSYNNNVGYTARAQIDANHSFGYMQRNNVVVNLGFEMNSNHYAAYSTTERGYFKNRGMSFISGIDLGEYPKYQQWIAGDGRPQLTDNLSNVVSAYLSMSYSYNDIVTLNANTRIDGSNKFGSRSNEKLLPVWSISTSYNLWQHLGNKDSKIVDHLAFRFSYGYQGNMLDNQTSKMVINKQPMDPHYGELISRVDTYPNPDLRWERTSSFNGGIDLSLFGGAIGIGSSVYWKTTNDAFLTKTISTVNGLSSYVVNSGTINNWGYSIDMTASPINKKNFRWTISTSYSWVDNSMKSSPSSNLYDYTDYLDGTALVAGMPVETFYSYKFIGLDSKDGGPLFDDYGDRISELLNKSKSEVFLLVMTPSGKREPTVQGNISNTFRYKSFRASMSLTYSVGNKMRLFKLYNDGVAFNPENNVNTDLLNRWMKPGDEKITVIPAIINSNSDAADKYAVHWSRTTTEDIPQFALNAWDMYNYSDIRVVDGSYLKCSNLSLTYDFPEGILKSLRLSMLSITASVSNLFTIASKELRGQSPTQSGFSTIQLPDLPTYSLGLNVTF